MADCTIYATSTPLPVCSEASPSMSWPPGSATRTPSITLRVYAHVISDQLAEAADIFARAIADTG